MAERRAWEGGAHSRRLGALPRRTPPGHCGIGGRVSAGTSPATNPELLRGMTAKATGWRIVTFQSAAGLLDDGQPVFARASPRRPCPAIIIVHSQHYPEDTGRVA